MTQGNRRGIALLLVWIVLAVWSGCGPPAFQQPTPTEVAEPATPATAVRPDDGPTAQPDHGPEIAAIAATTARIRQLSPLREVSTEFVGQERLGQIMAELLDRDYLPHERERDRRFLVLLGLIEPERDLVQTWLDLYRAEVVGLYESDAKKLYVVTDQPILAPATRVTLAHEYVHALQDQHFDLNRLQPKHSDNQDRLLAVDALIEGDATLAMSLYAAAALTHEEVAQLGGSRGSTLLDQVPLVMRTELLFPYTAGLEFVRRLHARGGFAAVDQAFRDPPQSTEQVLHPEKYDQREHPELVTLPDLSSAAGEGWQKHSEDTAGELYLRVLLEQFGERAVAVAAASGWGGDRWQLLTRGDQSILALRTVWDSASEAEEFFAAYTDGLGRRFEAPAQVDRSDGRVRMVAAGSWVSVERAGRIVDVVVAPEAAVGLPVSAALAQDRVPSGG